MTKRSRFYKKDGPTSRLSGDCAIAGCPRPRFRRELCCAHFKRWQRNKKLDSLIKESTAPGPTPLTDEEHVVTTGSAMLEANADDDEEYKKRRNAWLLAIIGWMSTQGWRAPKKKKKKTRVQRRARS